MQPAPYSSVVVIPAYNEEHTVGDVVCTLRSFGLPVIVVNDASSDDTAQIARHFGAIVVNLSANLGAWGATQCGFRKALQLGYDVVVTCDADKQHNPASVLELLDRQQQVHVDVLIGSCCERVSGARKFAWNIFRGITGLQVEDLTSGLRLYSKRAVAALAGSEGSLIDYQDVGVLLFLRGLGLRIQEHSVSMCTRVYGHSRIFRNWFVVFEYLTSTMLLSIGGNRFTVRKRSS